MSSPSSPSQRPPAFALRLRAQLLCGSARAQDPYLHYEAGIYPCTKRGQVRDELSGEIQFSYVDFRRSSKTAAEVLASDEDAVEYAALVKTQLRRRARFGQEPPRGQEPIAALRHLLPEETRLPNLLLIHKIHLLPHARGQGLAPRVLTEVMRRFGSGARLAALLPYPLQYGEAAGSPEWQSRMKYVRLDCGKRAAIQKLRALYAQAGFVPVRGTALMVADLARLFPAD